MQMKFKRIEEMKLSKFPEYKGSFETVFGLIIDDEHFFLMSSENLCCEVFDIDYVGLENLNNTEYVGYRSLTQSEVEKIFLTNKPRRECDECNEYGIEITSTVLESLPHEDDTQSSKRMRIVKHTYVRFRNSHNGYYSHTVYIRSKGINKEFKI